MLQYLYLGPNAEEEGKLAERELAPFAFPGLEVRDKIRVVEQGDVEITRRHYLASGLNLVLNARAVQDLVLRRRGACDMPSVMCVVVCGKKKTNETSSSLGLPVVMVHDLGLLLRLL